MSGTITVYHGKDGVNGTDGTDGEDGKDGTDGQDGTAPVIGVKPDTDGVYYWTLNGDWLRDSDGNKIPTTGKDGEDPEKYEGTLSLEYYSRYVPAEPSSFSIMIGGNADFKVQMGRDGEGLRYELDGRKCTIYIDKNTSFVVRWWIIGFWRPDYESRVYVDFNIMQMSPNSTIELSTHDLEIGPESGTYTIDVNRAPNKCGASATVDWIEVQYYDRLFLHVESNPFPFSRFGQVHVMDEDHNECYMNVFQEAGKNFLNYRLVLPDCLSILHRFLADII